MIYKKRLLILDNFRKVLKGFSVDVQDVVRSAILDGVDIGDYINSCKNNPYRLDQIRLGMKEGLDKVFFDIKKGEVIYKLRKLKETPNSLNTIKKYISNGTTNYDCLEKAIDWTIAGYDFYGIDISIIPKSLYDVFETGFQKGFNMSVFNTGRMYKPEYIKSCMVMMSNGIDVSPFVKDTLWDDDCLKQMANFSYIKSKEKWGKLIGNISPDISSEKLSLLITCVKNNIDISIISKGTWSADSIRYILKAFENGFDYKELISVGPDEDTVLSHLNKIMLNKSKRLSGRFLKS